MKYYNEKCQAWCMLDDATKDAIRASDCVEYMGCYGEWSKSTMKNVFCSGGIFRAPIAPKHIPLGPEDIKQGDAVRVKGLEANEKIWMYIEPYSCNDVMKVQSRNIVSFESLMRHYEIRSIGETEWRPCHKERK